MRGNMTEQSEIPVPGSEQDQRNVIRLLVKAHKLWQVRAVTLDKVLNAVMALPRAKRAALSVADIEAITLSVRPMVEAGAQQWAEQVERKLEKGDFLNAARVYASQQFWPERPSKAPKRPDPRSN